MAKKQIQKYSEYLLQSLYIISRNADQSEFGDRYFWDIKNYLIEIILRELKVEKEKLKVINLADEIKNNQR